MTNLEKAIKADEFEIKLWRKINSLDGPLADSLKQAERELKLFCNPNRYMVTPKLADHTVRAE